MRDLIGLEEAMAWAGEEIALQEEWADAHEAAADCPPGHRTIWLDRAVRARQRVDYLRTLLTALRSRPTVEEVARVIEALKDDDGDLRAAVWNGAMDDAKKAVLSLFGEEGK